MTTPLIEEHIRMGTDMSDHLTTLYMLTKELNLRIVVELGVRTGQSTVALASAVKEIGGHLYSYDINPCEKAIIMIKSYGLDTNWTFTQIDDLKVDWGVERDCDEGIDHLFIDTTHTYDQTTKELRKYEPYVRDGGIIMVHDIVSIPECLRAVRDYVKDRPDLHLYTYLNCFGLAVIFKRRKEEEVSLIPVNMEELYLRGEELKPLEAWGIK